MEIEVGIILIAKDTLSDTLIIGKEYSIIVTTDDYFYIKSEKYESHCINKKNLCLYFNIKETPKVERYVVMIESIINTIKVYNNYKEALTEAKKMSSIHGSTSHIYSAITKVELNDFKITEL